jgi:death-on-curing protein
LLFYLVSNHCFVDGNKRIGWLAAMRVLLSFGLTVSATDDEAEAFCMRIADSQKADAIRDGQDVVIWLSERLEAVPQSRN